MDKTDRYRLKFCHVQTVPHLKTKYFESLSVYSYYLRKTD